MNAPSPHHEDDEHEDEVFLEDSDIIEEINVDEEGRKKIQSFLSKILLIAYLKLDLCPITKLENIFDLWLQSLLMLMMMMKKMNKEEENS